MVDGYKRPLARQAIFQACVQLLGTPSKDGRMLAELPAIISYHSVRSDMQDALEAGFEMLRGGPMDRPSLLLQYSIESTSAWVATSRRRSRLVFCPWRRGKAML